MMTAEYRNVIDIEKYAKDGRLAGPSDGKMFDYRNIIQAVRVLGRPLTEDEAEKYRIK